MVVGGIAGPYANRVVYLPRRRGRPPAAPAGFPTTWDGAVDSESAAADYAMSSVPGYTTQQVISALSSLPTMSIVTTNANLFGASGIYSNSNDHNLEVPGSFEYFDPNNASTSYGALVGLQMYGGVGRQPQYLKHSMAILFDQSDGPSSMNYDIFGDGYEPDRLILRHGFNDGWAWGGANTQFIIDQWTRDALTALGNAEYAGRLGPAFRQRPVLGALQRRGAHRQQLRRALLWRRGGGLRRHPRRLRFQRRFRGHRGMEPDVQRGKVRQHRRHAGRPARPPWPTPPPTPSWRQYLNLPDFCDYIITNYYGGNWDWDWHNYSAIYSKTAGNGVRFPRLGRRRHAPGLNASNANVNITNRDTSGGPTELFVQLMANADFRAMFADHVYRDLNSVLSPTTAAAMYQKEANTVSQAIIDESARWGNLGTVARAASTRPRLGAPSSTRSSARSSPARTATMFSQFRDGRDDHHAFTRGRHRDLHDVSELQPADIVLINGTIENGGTFTPGDMLTMACDSTTGAHLLHDRRQRSAGQRRSDQRDGPPLHRGHHAHAGRWKSRPGSIPAAPGAP